MNAATKAPRGLGDAARSAGRWEGGAAGLRVVTGFYFVLSPYRHDQNYCHRTPTNESELKMLHDRVSPRVIDLTGMAGQGPPDHVYYSRANAESLVGRMVSARHDAGAYGKVVGVVGFRAHKFAKTRYALEVEWTRPPHHCRSAQTTNPYTVYDSTPSRSRDGPAQWLSSYEGYLQADAYGGYDGLFHSQNVTEVACWAHARRKFYDAQDSDEQRATQMLALIAQLYAVEREAKGADAATRLALREDRSVPVLARIKAWLDAEQEVVLPRSPMATAITYAQNQWAALCVYVTLGFLNIDNNASERALKRVALGARTGSSPATMPRLRITPGCGRRSPAASGKASIRNAT